jgi:hypothetical protein
MSIVCWELTVLDGVWLFDEAVDFQPMFPQEALDAFPMYARDFGSAIEIAIRATNQTDEIFLLHRLRPFLPCVLDGEIVDLREVERLGSGPNEARLREVLWLEDL